LGVLAFLFGNKIGKVRIDELLRRKQKGNNRKWLALSLSLSLSLHFI
jgi:ABC-type microcin C transport system permease subunit YejE